MGWKFKKKTPLIQSPQSPAQLSASLTQLPLPPQQKNHPRSEQRTFPPEPLHGSSSPSVQQCHKPPLQFPMAVDVLKTHNPTDLEILLMENIRRSPAMVNIPSFIQGFSTMSGGWEGDFWTINSLLPWRTKVSSKLNSFCSSNPMMVKFITTILQLDASSSLRWFPGNKMILMNKVYPSMPQENNHSLSLRCTRYTTVQNWLAPNQLCEPISKQTTSYSSNVMIAAHQ